MLILSEVESFGTYPTGTLHVVCPAAPERKLGQLMQLRTFPGSPASDYLPICGLPREHESRAQHSIRVGLRKGIDCFRKPRQSIATVLKGHLANHRATGDAGEVLRRECQEGVHDEAMRRADADETS